MLLAPFYEFFVNLIKKSLTICLWENRKIILHTKDGNEYITRRSLNEWMEELPNTFFYLVHKSFLVNLHYITKNSYSNIVLDNTIEIPVASRKQVDFHKYWFQYLKRR